MIAQGFLSIAQELRASRALQERSQVLLEILAAKHHVTAEDVERHEQRLREHGRSLTELELRAFNANGQNAE